VRKDSPLLVRSLSDFVAQAHKGDRLLAQVDRRYFVDNRWIRRPPKAEGLGEYAAALSHFRAYGPNYGLEWMRLLAQGFQESGLDQSARGPTGAVGIMQILPTTAAAAPIGLSDVFRMEENVHAGAKYMRHLLDTYLDEPGLSDEERFRLALASYNAGPNRVATLRRRAAAAGLDPNVWYGNVEMMAAKHVGQETVVYVSNIEKYLFAFRAVLAIDGLREGADAR
jgi:membrane-bound lytic murein transglycosylase MltF